MKKNVFIIAILLTAFFLFFSKFTKINAPNQNKTTVSSEKEIITNNLVFEIIATNLDTPWAIAFLPDNKILVTERKGTIKVIELNNLNYPLINEFVVKNVKEIGEGGLMGITTDPNFQKNKFVYIYYTYEELQEKTYNRVSRMTFINNSLENEKIILDKIPGNANHNGGRIKFGPDQYLYVETGDAQDPSFAQDTNSLAGKILRIKDDGTIPPDNPFNNPIYSYGHRNPQGLAWDSQNNLWATEHGKSNPSGFDEINLIKKGNNYGWPVIEGSLTNKNMELPMLHSGKNSTWAPSGADFVGNSLFFAGLRGEALYEAIIQNNMVIKLDEHFKEKFGRIREVIKGPDNALYITTSNKDGRGTPEPDDDKIIRIYPNKL